MGDFFLVILSRFYFAVDFFLSGTQKILMVQIILMQDNEEAPRMTDGAVLSVL